MDTSRGVVALESKRNASSSLCFTRSSSAPGKLKVVDTERQQVCGLVPEERGRHQVVTSDGPNIHSCCYPRSLQDTYRDTLPTGSLQCRGGSLVLVDKSTGMASLTQNNRENILQVGRPGDRFIRISRGTRCSEVRDTRYDGPACLSSQCVQSAVELFSGMGVSAPVPNASSVAAPQLIERCVPGSSPTMEQSFLETRPQEPCSRSPIYDMSPESGSDRRHNRPSTSIDTGHGVGGLEMWGWTKSLAGWSQEHKQFLQKGWRESSLKTYRIAWQRWCVWADENAVSISKPEGSDLGRFLLDLHLKHGLAYNTILVYKSAISTLCDPNISNRLSSHLLVKQALKSISIQNVKTIKAPIWDTDLLTNWLKDSAVDLDSLCECSACTAILLLLCSGRRVHDLTLLAVNKENCTVTDNSITLWPIFGSKTDSVTNRQSGWRLFRNKDYQTLDPIFWLNKVIVLSQSRRSLCKQNHLFLTVSGPPKAASRTVIGGWVKKILCQAGIRASPGSIRPAVASKNWVQNCSIDDILAQGNWLSENTFAKYYRREICPAGKDLPNQSISSLFAPVIE